MAAHHHRDLTGSALRQAFFLTAFILVLEAAAGYLSHSLALLADAGHILVDVIALGLAWFAVVQSRRPADARRTYGYHRVGILTAFANGATLIAIVAGVAFEAAHRLAHPEPVQGGLVVGAALVAVAVNTYIALRLSGDHHDLSLRAVRLHVLGDLVASIGVVAAGAVIALTGWLPADPIVSLAIATLIAWSAYRILLDTMNVLLEGVPRGMEIEHVAASIGESEGV
ncbi:MAG: cation diffusion facilitator family transporter, partial [Candidatus Dormibacteraeota bacterium]|nr:cation diffusion facilitator family transporter [Candidatus Dormibacteraeota bacterium]